VIKLGPFLRAEHGTEVWDVTVRDERVLQTLRVAPDDGAEEVVHPLQNDGVVAGEILEGQVRSLAAHGVEEHCGTEGGVRPGVLIVNEALRIIGRSTEAMKATLCPSRSVKRMKAG